MGDEMLIDQREEVHFDDTSQWIRIRGVDASNPVLLLMQQGPGLPMMNEARRFEHLLGLEQAFTVVYWDQRGCGRSLRGPEERDGVTIDGMVSDTISLLQWLRDRFGREVFVIGFSFGAAIAALAAARRPDLVDTLVAVGMDIDGKAASNSAYDFALTTAVERGKRRAIRQLQAIGPPPHVKLKQFSTRVRWATNFGGVTTHETYNTLARGLLVSMVMSPDYSVGDIIRTIRGMSSTQAALLSDLASMDLTRSVVRLEVPVVMVQGRLDQVAPGEAAKRFAASLEARSKQLVWFEQSAHTPHLEQPEKFRDLLMRVLAKHPAEA
jgi:pimeloyl-ACP methyl ester carboxylesterase